MTSEQSDDDIFVESPTHTHHRCFSSSSSSPRLVTRKHTQESSCKRDFDMFDN